MRLAVAGFSSARFGVAEFVRIQTASPRRLNSHESSYQYGKVDSQLRLALIAVVDGRSNLAAATPAAQRSSPAVRANGQQQQAREHRGRIGDRSSLRLIEAVRQQQRR